MTLSPMAAGPATAEALLHLAAARRLASALLTEPGWLADPVVTAALAEHIERAEQWLAVAAWPDQFELAA